MRQEAQIMQLLDYLRDMVEEASKVPITGKVVVDRKEMLETIDQVVNYLPDEIKKAQWLLTEKDRILQEAKKENESVRLETIELMKKRIENHNIVKEAEIRAQEIIALAHRQAKSIRLGSREYADEVLSQLQKEIDSKTNEFLMHMKNNMETFALNLSDDINKTSNSIRENIKELRDKK
ncbi:ATPase [Clostridium tarantellae]|uniref:ATPase n=1 Tax=Clostridium tarantellae TaxID=39493 RepID=A0A6I1MJW7_9CLOT|nr:ATPase [Clostridium tarantellae]MPQ42437.1 ATPase [Clostridium tarantellae]